MAEHTTIEGDRRQCVTCGATLASGKMSEPCPAPVSAASDLEQRLREAAKRKMTPAERREQRISFVYGQMMDCAPHITREQVAAIVDKGEEHLTLEERDIPRTNTPPAASERMTAEQIIEGMTDCVGPEKWFNDCAELLNELEGRERDLLALVDKQSAELASAKRAAQIENAKLVELDDRIQSLERELAAVTASRDGWRKKCTDAFVTETKAIDAAERDR